jgi:hypothetical protein
MKSSPASVPNVTETVVPASDEIVSRAMSATLVTLSSDMEIEPPSLLIVRFWPVAVATVSVYTFNQAMPVEPRSSVESVSDIIDVFTATAARFDKAVFAPPPAAVRSTQVEPS